MKVILHLATSADGFIAKSDGDSSWVSAIDEELFKNRVQEAGCVVIGKTTFEQYRDSIYPIKNAFNIILTSGAFETEGSDDVVHASSPQQAIALAEAKGYSSLIIAGGAKTADAFLEAGLVSEVYLSVHPLMLGEGKKLSTDFSNVDTYKLLDKKSLSEGITELHYTVV
jgi:dihydrofolate reductase